MSKQSLVDFLSKINSAGSSWGLWVNPENIDEYRIGQYCFENGSIHDNWVNVGSLDLLTSNRINYAGYDDEFLDYEWAVSQVEEIKSVLALMG